MKALSDHLFWVQRYVNGEMGDRSDPKNIEVAQDCLIALQAIADALPEISISLDPAEAARMQPKRIIDIS